MSQLKEQYKAAAISIANSICRDAVWDDNRCNWIGSSSEENYGTARGYAKALGTNFYDGAIGISWFLLNASLLHNQPIILKTAKASLEQVIHTELKKKPTDQTLPGKLGFHTGWTGIAYVLSYAADLLEEPAYKKAAAQFIEKIMALPQEYWGLDVIDGPAGAIPALIHCYKKQPSAPLQQFIISLGNYLIEKADKQPNGWSWDTMQERTHNLTGYGHGTAGFATAFAELFSFTGDTQYLQIVKAIVQYEDSHFDTAQQNWPDYRKFETGHQQPTENSTTVCSLAWCHGAPGIGLSRLRILEVTNDPYFKHGVDAAVSTTLKNLNVFSVGNYSMCHGVFGNAELILYAAKVLNKPQLIAATETAVNECISDFVSKRITLPNGLQSGHDTPDFMLGSSGMGYFFLRMIDSEKFPCMLLLRP